MAQGEAPLGITVFWTVFGCVSMKAKNGLFLLCLENFSLCFPPRSEILQRCLAYKEGAYNVDDS